jgi:hypothetical protein
MKVDFEEIPSHYVCASTEWGEMKLEREGKLKEDHASFQDKEWHCHIMQR